MTIDMKLIDEMRKRTNCSYQEAKELLEKHNGDLIEAIVEFEKKQAQYGNFSGYNGNSSTFGNRVKRMFHKGNVTRFSVEKGEETYLNIPVNILLLILLITMPIFWFYAILVGVLYVLGYKIRIKKDAGRTVEINTIMDDLSSKVKSAAKWDEKPAANTNQTPGAKKDQGENEITIE
ncbi:DUF4342 domain-containing protein [Dehalobacterium formicoaceticum]|uniref:DUF4342 domain-containing protein n=1 Tax=Dehalobacterium formicoaceticum TaxID=51515 RepID=A0ABT1Y6C0_9FIRM|nr:DUF4342 domain-containing protein [Dehalobacterium formicoaceticum]MCR6546419.1 DUF4342 domain-containing protein [Dehalobacterium formicoaceticum]